MCGCEMRGSKGPIGGDRGSREKKRRKKIPNTLILFLPCSARYCTFYYCRSPPASVGKGSCTSLSQSRQLDVPVRPANNPAMGRVQSLKRGGGAPGYPSRL